jgi:hypothetical protein
VALGLGTQGLAAPHGVLNGFGLEVGQHDGGAFA